MDDIPETHLSTLGPRFLQALNLRSAGRVDQALDAFQAILKDEPRLAEPRMEIARILLEMGKLDDAEEEAREALRILEAGGQWTDEIPEPVLQAMAWALLGEILKEKAASDEVVFGDPAVFSELLDLSRAAFFRAAELDPSDSASFVNAQELGDKPARAELGDEIPEDEEN